MIPETSYLSVCAIFKNESLNLKEWLDHYLNRGADNIFLINDGSTDQWKDIVFSHEYKNKIHVFENDIPKRPNRQVEAYDKFFLPVKNFSSWTLICDLDEFVYSPYSFSLKDVLSKFDNSPINCIYANWVMFNSNNNINHPSSIIDSCIVRMKYGASVNIPINGQIQTFGTNSYKYFVKKSCQINSLGVHSPLGIEINSINLSYEQMNDPILLINHYATQSKEFWEKSKMVRGDVNMHHSDNARNWDYFQSLDLGNIIDTRLRDQNANLKNNKSL
jgi:hypothetical protein